jgi:hypothetical protein
VKAITTYKVNQHQISVELRKTDQTLRLKSNGNEQNKKRNDKREKNTFETRVANPLEYVALLDWQMAYCMVI